MRKIGLSSPQVFRSCVSSPCPRLKSRTKGQARPCMTSHVLSEGGGRLRSSFGLEVTTEAFGDDEFDTLLVGFGLEVSPTSPGLARYFSSKPPNRHRRLASICLGSFTLGDAGLPRRASRNHALALRAADGRAVSEAHASTWTRSSSRMVRFGRRQVCSAASDLAVGMIESDHGAELARLVAKGMVMHHRRAGGQSQHSALLLDLDEAPIGSRRR